MISLKESLITKDNIKNAMTNDNYLVACIDISKINKEILNYLYEYYVCQIGITGSTACYVIDEKNLIKFMREYEFYNNISILKPRFGKLQKAEVIKLIKGDKKLRNFIFCSKDIIDKAKDRTYKV